MRIALIHSRQPGNQYAGGAKGVDDSENYWMFKLILQIAAILRAWGIEVDAPDNTDYNKSGSLTFADNVAYINARKDRNYAVGFSNHSNAMGDSCILYGTSTSSLDWAKKLQTVLNRMKFMPFGDSFEFNPRKVSETSHPYCPFVLVEWGRHDREDYAEWLRANIENGFLAEQAARAYAEVLGWNVPTNVPPPPVPTTDPLAARPAPPDYPLDNGCHKHGLDAYFGPRYPLTNLRSVSGYYSHGEDLKVWQQRMAARGWRIGATGRFDSQTESVVRAFQKEKFGSDDGALGRNTWDAAWLEPVT